MVSLTFAEQVKIILSRRGMTIKELAEIIEERTGKKMSRQNLTQRLNRDNFQEQDMRMITDILNCSFQLNILEAPEEIISGHALEPTPKELMKVNKKRQKREEKNEIVQENERDITLGEFAEMMGEEPTLAELIQEPTEPVMPEETVQIEPEVLEADELPEPEPKEEVVMEAAEVNEPEVVTEEKTEEADKPNKFSKGGFFKGYFIKPKVKNKVSNETKEIADDQSENDGEDREKGDVNPYTGREYQSNSVRIHPKRIGYVQVYDRGEHKWTDMTEWAFLGYQERKKALLGDDYEPPIYLD